MHFSQTAIKPRSWTFLIFRQLPSDGTSVLHWSSKVGLFVEHILFCLNIFLTSSKIFQSINVLCLFLMIWVTVYSFSKL